MWWKSTSRYNYIIFSEYDTFSFRNGAGLQKSASNRRHAYNSRIFPQGPALSGHRDVNPLSDALHFLHYCSAHRPTLSSSLITPFPSLIAPRCPSPLITLLALGASVTWCQALSHAPDRAGPWRERWSELARGSSTADSVHRAVHGIHKLKFT